MIYRTINRWLWLLLAAQYRYCGVQEFLLLDWSGLLLKQDFQEHERHIECNMQSEACFHARTPCISLCYGEHTSMFLSGLLSILACCEALWMSGT